MTLDNVGDGVDDLRFELDEPLPATAASRRAGLFAVGTDLPSQCLLDQPTRYDCPDDVESKGILVVLDAATGAEVSRVERSSRVTAVGFDSDGRTLLAGAEDGTIVTVDSATGQEVREEVAMIDSAEIIAVGLRPDGVVIAVGRRSIELYDHAGNRRGLPLDIPAADEARIRPDGTVVVVPSADTDSIQIVDLNRGPLVERGWDVEADALVGFGAGRAAVVDRSSSADVIDLTSGEPTPLTLRTPSGDPFVAVGITPEVDGYLAWNDGTPWPGGEADELVEAARTLDRRAERQPDRGWGAQRVPRFRFRPERPGDVRAADSQVQVRSPSSKRPRRRRCMRSTHRRATLLPCCR